MVSVIGGENVEGTKPSTWTASPRETECEHFYSDREHFAQVLPSGPTDLQRATNQTQQAVSKRVFVF